MRRLLTLLRWGIVLTPIAVTATWVRATSARPPTPRFARTGGAALDVSSPAPPAVRSPARMAHVLADRPDPCDVPLQELDAGGEAAQVFFASTSQRRVALTFDDGPSRENTPRILDVLARKGVPATFFVLGHRARVMPDLLRDIDHAGHELANHGDSHRSLKSLWASEIRDEVCDTQRAILEATGRRPRRFRPPFGRFAPSAAALLGQLGYDIVLWSVDAEDWRYTDPDQLAAAVVRAAHPGAIILLHDRESVTVHALPSIIVGLQRRGFDIVPLSTLAEPSETR